MSMTRWICGFTLKEMKKSPEVIELFVLEEVSIMIKYGTLK